jgi:outer membrane protein assembly factor BamB/ribosomal protein L7/L12
MSTNAPTSLNCPTCGAPLEADGTRAVVRCKFCGNSSLIPGILPAQAVSSSVDLDEIRKAAGGGNLADAIERFSQAYGVDQQEARNAIDALQAGRLATPTAAGLHTPQELTKALVDVQHALAKGDKIGAIKIYREYFDVSLARAKYAIDQIAAGQTSWPEAGFRPAVVQAQERRTSAAGKWLATIITLSIILFVGGILVFAMLQSGGPLHKHYIPNGAILLVPSGQEAAPDIAALFYDPAADARFIGLVDGATAKLRWQAAKLSGGGYVSAIAYGPDLVYAANETDLLAYQKSDGSLAWQARMPDKLNYGAATMLVTAGRVITINADQTIQAYEAETGRLVWSKRLSGYDRTLRLMGSLLVVIDYTDSNYHYGLLLLDPATGDQKGTFTPTCTSNDYTSDLSVDSGLVYEQAENALLLVYDSAYGCVQRLDLASGQISWSASSKDGFHFSPEGFQYLMSDSRLYFSNDNDLVAVDLTSGNMQVLANNPDYYLLPLAKAGDTLIVRARRTRGTERFELWGLDAVSGSLVWRLDMQGASPIDPPNEMSGLIDDSGAGWTWKLAPAGLELIKFQAKPNQIVMETFNPADGTSQAKQTVALNKVSGDFYSIPTVIGWQGSLAYMSLDGNIYALDGTTGKLKLVY